MDLSENIPVRIDPEREQLHVSVSGDLVKKKSRTNCCVPKCSVWGYPEVNGQKVMYHKFPKDPKTQKDWLIRTRCDVGKTFKLSESKVVCSLHFKHDDYIRNGWSRPALKKDAVPSTFSCWDEIPHITKPKHDRPRNKLQQHRETQPSCLFIANIDTELYTTTPVTSKASTTCNSTLSIKTSSDTCFSTTVISVEETLRFAMYKLQSLVLQNQINELETLIKMKDERLIQLGKYADSMLFRVENLTTDQDIIFYTGFPSLEVFNLVLELLDPGENGENVVMRQSEGAAINTGKTGRKRTLSPREQFFLVMCRLRVGLFERDLAVRFGIGKSSVSNIVVSWINFMYLRLGSINIWPTRAAVDKYMPFSFREKYPSTRVIIDATELKCEMPSSLLLKSQSFSNYKSANTVKGLIGITPGGSVCFISQLYTGCISDKDITDRSGFLKLPFDEGDSIMADKGFEYIRPLLPSGVSLNIPPFLGQVGQMSHNDVLTTQSIAAERIHVERAIRKIKEFHIFDQIIPLTLIGIINQMWTVCGLLTLFQNPVISQ